jgi:hypothetical protein
MRLWIGLLAAFVLWAAPVRADEAKLSAALDAFEQLTLWRDAAGTAAGGAVPTGGITRWNQALRVRMVGRSSSSERASTTKYLRQVAEIAGLAVTIEDGEGTGENFKIEFFPEYGAPPVLQSAGCLARHWSSGGAMTRVELYIRSGSRGFERCVSHEMLHGFGILAHPHELRSVMSYTQQGFSDYTPIDIAALRLLYHASVRPGVFHLPAMIAARQIIAEELGLVAAGGDTKALGRPVMDRAVARLRQFAQGGATVTPYLAMQLGNAYWFGQYVEIDRAEARRQWEIAAEKENADGRYRLGWMFTQAQSAERDDAKALHWLSLAATQNHGAAMLLLSGLRAEGRGGVPADPVEAYAWASIAASRNVQGAAAARDKLGAGLSEAQIAEAKTRAEKLVPQPAR